MDRLTTQVEVAGVNHREAQAAEERLHRQDLQEAPDFLDMERKIQGFRPQLHKEKGKSRNRPVTVFRAT